MIPNNVNISKVRRAYNLDEITESYLGPVLIDDLKDSLNTKGHLLVIRGDKAYQEEVGENGNPKFWLYENLLKTKRVSGLLKRRPDFDLFDGTGKSSLKALNYFANVLGRKAVIVTSREIYEGINPDDFRNVEIIKAQGPAEEGYVEKQKEILQSRRGLIPLTQALYGAQSLAPIGNNVVSQLENMAITPDESYWVCASGSNLYGIGGKIKKTFPNCRVNLVEPMNKRTIDPNLDLNDSLSVRNFAKNELMNYKVNENNIIVDPKDLPLHVEHANVYLLNLWLNEGKTGIDEVVGVSAYQREQTRSLVQATNQDYLWTGTTYSALAPAIESAKKGNNVIVMAYGRE